MRTVLVCGLASALIGFGLASAADAQVVKRSGNVYYRPVCGDVPGTMARCHADVVTDSAGHVLSYPTPPISGKSPSDLRSAYNMKANGNAATIVAIVDAFGYDNAESDLGVYRSQFQLPPCTTKNGCFRKLNEHGHKSTYAQNIGWAQESALDLDMVSTACPNCTIYLVEARSNSTRSLGSAVNEAASLGAHVISNSYGGRENKRTVEFEVDYDHPGIAVTASTGDSGYGVQSPADMPVVIAVGGTTLVTDTNKRGWSETVWSGAGSGCSKLFTKPTWQTDPGCPGRMIGDTAADANPATGVAVYGPNSAGVSTWMVFGGTSVAAPLVGGVFGANGGTVNAASTIYADPTKLYDVTAGSNGTCHKAYFCTGEVGYDGPTGMGTPNGDAAFGN
jgi:subtilase family serine protease